ncbi:MAG TPA: hypothetical protein VJI13_05135 [Candidatus Norongarragalinales archaeon]|nr:hypothetical protein [Candidatus Norongarragalinales archaeon]
MEEFILLQCNFPDLQIDDGLKGAAVTDSGVLALLEKTFEAIRKKTYDFAPIDKNGISNLAAQHAPKMRTIPDFITLLSGLKPGGLEAQILPFCRDDRNPERVSEKKLSPVTDIAVDYFICCLYEKLFPVKVNSSGKPPKKEFRFASNLKGWVVIRKVNLEVAEKKEVLACLVHTLESMEPKFAQYRGGTAFFTRLDALLAKYPSRKSFGKLMLLLQEASKEGLLSQTDSFLNKYALYKLLAQLGYSPYLTGELLEGIYPELKIPKPRGRLKKA